MRSRGKLPSRRRSPSSTPPLATRASPRWPSVIRSAPRTPRGFWAWRGRSRSTSSWSAGASARPRARRRASPLRVPRLRPERGRRRASRGSKSFAKEVMAAAGVATAPRLAIARPPCVVKADGLAAGKGVFVCRTQAEVDEAMRALADREGHRRRGASRRARGVALRDLRRTRGATAGLGTGLQARIRRRRGAEHRRMGAYAPASGSTHPAAEALVEQVHSSARELAERGAPVRRVALRGSDADPGRRACARVQLQIRRSRDAGRRSAARGDLLETLAALRAATCRWSTSALGWGGGDGGARGGAVSGGGRPRRDDRGRRGAEAEPARSCSTPERRSTASAW